MKLRLGHVWLATLMLLLAACGGSGINVSEGGISGSGISVGRITTVSAADITLNDTTLQIDNQTQVVVDEQTATTDDLPVGSVIRVTSDFSAKRAHRIDYVETVRGPLASTPTINSDTFAGSLTVLGQSVLTNGTTVFADIADPAALTAGEVLDVSGVRDASGRIVASYIERKSPTVNEYRLVGIVTQLTPTTFVIGNLTIDYSSADLSGLTGNSLTANTDVRVRADSTAFNAGNTTLSASRISDSVLSFNTQSNDSAEIEGVITIFSSISDFSLNGLSVDASNAMIVDGVQADIQLNARIEAEGTINNQGKLIATKVKIQKDNNTRVEAVVDSVNTLSNTVVALGVTVQVDSSTQLDDKSTARIRPFTLANLAPGDFVRIRGRRGSLDLAATRLERRNASNRYRLQSRVDAGGVDTLNKTVTILGVTVTTDSSTSYEDANGQSLSETQFFSAVTPASTVKARWNNFTSASAPVNELSLED